MTYGSLRFDEIRQVGEQVSMGSGFEMWTAVNNEWIVICSVNKYCFTGLVQRLFDCNTIKTSVLPQIERWTVWRIDHLSASSYTLINLFTHRRHDTTRDTHWACSGGNWRLVFSENNKHHPTPFWRFCDAGTVYRCHDLLTYFNVECISVRVNELETM